MALAPPEASKAPSDATLAPKLEALLKKHVAEEHGPHSASGAAVAAKSVREKSIQVLRLKKDSGLKGSFPSAFTVDGDGKIVTIGIRDSDSTVFIPSFPLACTVRRDEFEAKPLEDDLQDTLKAINEHVEGIPAAVYDKRDSGKQSVYCKTGGVFYDVVSGSELDVMEKRK
jgi:hypothetical protein